MQIKYIQDTDFVNYKKAASFIAMPFCTFKCEKECGKKMCQNSELATSKTYTIDTKKLVERCLDNKLTSAIVFGGLEPLDSFDDLIEFISIYRKESNNDIVIYTGYVESEVLEKINKLKTFPNIIVKFGRFIPQSLYVFDEVLGVTLASNNQYAKKIS